MKLAVQAACTALLALLTLLPTVDATAQDNTWSFLVTPQIWATHVEKNGFSTPAGPQFIPAGVPLFSTGTSHQTDYFDPQAGLQLAAQKGRWTLAGSFQYVNFVTQSNVIFTPPPGDIVLCGSFSPSDCLRRGDRAATEYLDTTRLDMDFAVRYFFPHVLPAWLDFSIGGGVKAIYAEATRKFRGLSVLATEANGNPPPGLYLICAKDDCLKTGQIDATDRIKTKTWVYGATVPLSAILHVSTDGKWFLPLNVSPFIGAETRDDRNVVFQLNDNGTVRRLDGTTFAYGATADASIRWVLTERLSVYGGFRVQYIKGHEPYLAYGPLFGLSIRFAAE